MEKKKMHKINRVPSLEIISRRLNLADRQSKFHSFECVGFAVIPITNV